MKTADIGNLSIVTQMTNSERWTVHSHGEPQPHGRSILYFCRRHLFVDTVDRRDLAGGCHSSSRSPTTLLPSTTLAAVSYNV